MSRQKLGEAGASEGARRATGEALPPTKPAVGDERPADPLNDSTADVWARWSRDREQRRLEELMAPEGEESTHKSVPAAVPTIPAGSRRTWGSIRPSLGTALGKATEGAARAVQGDDEPAPGGSPAVVRASALHLHIRTCLHTLPAGAK
jgi:hypothetical protein